jgi:hypothetical protein
MSDESTRKLVKAAEDAVRAASEYPELRDKTVPADQLLWWAFRHHEHVGEEDEPMVSRAELIEWVIVNAT